MIRKLMTSMLVVVSASALFSQAQSVGSFTKLKVYDQLKVELIPSEDYKAEITGKNAHAVTFVNNGNELKLRMPTSKLMQGDDTVIKLYYKTITDLQASQGSIISSKYPLDGNSLNLVSNEGSVIDIPLKVSNLSSKANTGALITLSGSSLSQDVVVNAGGKYHAKDLVTETSKIAVNAGGEARVFATKDMTSTVRAGGNIDVYGEPEHRNEKKIIGGKINYK